MADNELKTMLSECAVEATMQESAQKSVRKRVRIRCSQSNGHSLIQSIAVKAPDVCLNSVSPDLCTNSSSRSSMQAGKADKAAEAEAAGGGVVRLLLLLLCVTHHRV